MTSPDVTFETKCWDADWRLVLNPRYLRTNIARHEFPFARRVVMINNVADRRGVEAKAAALVADGVIDDYDFVEDFAQDALASLEVDRGSFGTGYYYSIAELVSVYRCTTEFLLHYSGDSWLPHSSAWVGPAIELLRERPDIVVVNPVWNHRFDEAEHESTTLDRRFFYGYGFSDQCYLVRTADFRAPIYNEQHAMSERYPRYGGELFEKRVDAWMRNHRKLRATFRHDTYVHRNIPRTKLGQALYLLGHTGFFRKK